jgi:hypothetical protein
MSYNIAVNTVSINLQIDQDQIITFFEKLYGGCESRGYLVLWTRNDRRSNFFSLNQIKEAAQEAATLAAEKDVYFAVGLQKTRPSSGRGSADTVTVIPGLWCDIDIKGPGHGRSDLPETVDDALELAHAIEGFPPTLLVHSGGGIHAYWLFKEPWVIESKEEREKAQILVRSWEDTLRQHAKEKGYHLDSTSDLARVLRVPFTFNHKDPENPVAVKLLEEASSGRRYNPSDFEPYLLDKELVVAQPTFLNEFDNADGQRVLERCPFIRHCVSDAKSLDEPAWYAMLTIAARCSMGDHLAHEWSKPYVGYDRKKTDRKLQHAKAAPGPYTCENISKRIDGAYCSDCEYQGRVKSPIVLGRELSEEEICDGHIEELNRKHAAVMVEGRFLVINEVRDQETRFSKITFSTPQDFIHKYRTVTVPSPKSGPGQSREIAIGKLWLDSPKRRIYDGLVFSPQREVPGMYNLWRGFGVRPRPGNWELFKKHIFNVIANRNEEVYSYILAWMAHLVQHPGGPRPGTAIVLRGKQGTGKGVFANNFGKLFGPHYIQVFTQRQITGRFNTHLKDALLVNADEAMWAGDKKAEGVIKGLITEERLPVEPKGKDIFYVDNHTRWIFTTNNEWAAPAGMEERRFFVLDISDRHQQDIAYFKAIVDQLKKGGYEAMLYDLMHHDISSVDLSKFSRTTALMDQIVSSMTTVQKFWYHRLREGSLIDDPVDGIGYGKHGDNKDRWGKGVETKDFHDAYLQFSKSLGEKYLLDPSQFGRQLKSVCPGVRRTRKSDKTDGHERRPIYIFPPLEVCRAEIERQVNMPIDWDE